MIVRRQDTLRQRQTNRVQNSKRRGSMALAAMMSLLVIVGGVAVALDRLWLDSAQTELEAAVEAAALRGGQFLACDDLLRPESDIAARLERAREAAGDIASKNLIAGNPVELDITPEGDIRFGRLVHRGRTGDDVFLETNDRPTSVVVRAVHSRARNNPVAMFLKSVIGNKEADVAALSEATIDNQVVGLQPLADVPVPVLPIAILRGGSGGDRRGEDGPRGEGRRHGNGDANDRGDDEGNLSESWTSQIDDREGGDQYRFDELTGQITEEPDGIPEIRVRSAVRRGNPKQANVHLFVVNQSSSLQQLVSQVRSGWSESDMPGHLSTMRLDEGSHEFETVNGINGSMPQVLRELIGECRILFLYDRFLPAGRSGAGRIQIEQAVAGRILSVTELDDECCELIIQPGVLTTRTALLASESGSSTTGSSTQSGVVGAPRQLANRYIYKLQITN
ncbi:MAG: hypothetical protein O3B13_18620 [Planctomycetota bacterium]|nr:hypothetical protein [Planctomycetota bacterium]MDA1165116.1 hypothetical protein [Planctomycetota bacterium]